MTHTRRLQYLLHGRPAFNQLRIDIALVLAMANDALTHRPHRTDPLAQHGDHPDAEEWPHFRNSPEASDQQHDDERGQTRPAERFAAEILPEERKETRGMSPGQRVNDIEAVLVTQIESLLVALRIRHAVFLSPKNTTVSVSSCSPGTSRSSCPTLRRLNSSSPRLTATKSSKNIRARSCLGMDRTSSTRRAAANAVSCNSLSRLVIAPNSSLDRNAVPSDGSRFQSTRCPP